MAIDRICTIGPASNKEDVLAKLLEKGMTIARLNLSHGSHESHKKIIDTVRFLDPSIQILGDLQGPKIRLGVMKLKEVVLKEGTSFVLYTEEVSGNEKGASVDYKGIVQDVQKGSKILMNDGQVELIVERVEEDKLVTKVKKGGVISSHKGVNLPATRVRLPAITEKDKQDIRFLVKEKVDFLACSFVRTPEHLKEIKDFIHLKHPNTPKLIAKVETMEAIENFQRICEEGDGIMIARGDLGVELPYEWIPLLQKILIHECRLHDKYVITATQMLQSMVDSTIPTRAEVTDVFQAVFDGTNAVMLSAETAAGKYPIESIETLYKISYFAETILNKNAPSLSEFLTMLKSSR
ncbi:MULTISPECIES: pyruvate kinase [Priestia]|uniref:Pyruvate kinase n=1 Tax=Priestia megaterium TaxID=1404 RepID=A0ABD4WT24_PRIMG|nr:MULTISPECIES: pyruvate kinase [Priestia]MDD9783399.1 pyruvate kinase [Priestia megaterium]MDR7245019.1 pyruvate kinase [Priestia megaterium]QTL50973.1 pyruvate kinase [Priestia aryabhattai]USL43940.1 pyruvate kinase [Priestia megaterium]